MRHAAEPVAKDGQCMTAQSYPKPQNTRERKNTKRVRVQGLGFIGLIGLIRFIGFIGF